MVRQSKLARPLYGWINSLDKPTLFTAIALLTVGLLLVISSSPVIASKIGFDETYFIFRQLASVLLGVFVALFLSALEEKWIRRLMLLALIICITLLAIVPFVGHTVKGAKRWIRFAGMFAQPSELLKPCMIIFTASMFERHGKSRLYAIGLLIAIEALLLTQPDVGMSILFLLTFCFQLFISGMPIVLVALALLGMGGGGVSAYFIFSHIYSRIRRFFSAEPGYQVSKALNAFANGGLLGVGLGEGEIKDNLPDSHTDFIFSVAGEEMGTVTCLLIAACFLFIAIRNLNQAKVKKGCFQALSISGIAFSICAQACINISVNLNLVPTKGMTLPFLSYGGSSILSSCVCLGLLLALTKKRRAALTYQLKHFNV